jgi:hypothetical protein
MSHEQNLTRRSLVAGLGAAIPAAAVAAPTFADDDKASHRMLELKARFDAAWARQVASGARQDAALDVLHKLIPEAPPELLRRAASDEPGCRQPWYWCTYSLGEEDAPPNAAQLMPIAEAYERAKEEATEASGIKEAEGEGKDDWSEACDIAQEIMLVPVANGADMAIKLAVWSAAIRDESDNDNNLAEEYGWMDDVQFRLLRDAAGLLGLELAPARS